jgi:hypothetical protein
MHRTFLLVVFVVLIFVASLPCAFAQSNLHNHSANNLKIIAQKDVNTSTNDRAFWDSVKDSKNPDELKAYLEQFPSGIFAPLAKARLKSLEKGNTQSGKSSESDISTLKEIARDGSLIAYDNGTVLDTSTNLMWAAKDNDFIVNWFGAKSYCEEYRGGGYTDWRMPTGKELMGIYNKIKRDKGKQLITTTSIGMWASETKNNVAGAIMWVKLSDKEGVVTGSHDQSDALPLLRALPVRSVK